MIDEAGDMNTLGFSYPPEPLMDQAIPQSVFAEEVSFGARETGILASFYSEMASVTSRMQKLSHEVKQQVANVVLEQDDWSKEELQRLLVFSNALDGILAEWLDAMVKAQSMMSTMTRNLNAMDASVMMTTRMSYMKSVMELRKLISERRVAVLNRVRIVLREVPLRIKGDLSVELLEEAA